MSPPKRRPINLGQHALVLRRIFLGSEVSIRNARLTWIGWLQPTGLSRRYSVRIDLAHDGLPHVRVVEPILESRRDEQLPHTYRDGTLCLYRAGEWHPSLPLAMLVPWASEWLLNYEIWLATGEWYGGGEWPPRRTDPLKTAA